MITEHDRVVEGTRCVYCGVSVFGPHVTHHGDAVNLDHFIPKANINIARKYHPKIVFENWLLPSCPLCNGAAGGYTFATLREKVDFVRASRARRALTKSEGDWQVTEVEIDDGITAAAFAELMRPIEEALCGLRFRLMACPTRVDGVWYVSERILPLCTLEKHLAALSKMAPLSSPDTLLV
jgi:hypothetical protein